MLSRLGITRLLAVTLLLSLLITSLPASTIARDHALQADPVPDRSRVDLATVPVTPDLLPEPGYQLVQGGRLDYSAIHYSLSGDGQPSSSDTALDDIEDQFTGAYSMILGLHEDRGDASSEIIASVMMFRRSPV